LRIELAARIRNPKCARGFTLVEAVISMIIVAVMFVASLNTVGMSKLTQHKAVLVSRGRMFAESLLAEIQEQAYQDPVEPHVFGRETGELPTSRTAYDDVDDYHGWSESPPVAKDGTALPNSANWRRIVTVEWVDPLNPQQVSATETGAKRITVVATFRNVPQATVVAVKVAN
jgi:type II secretory pathway pseudopilin PulG